MPIQQNPPATSPPHHHPTTNGTTTTTTTITSNGTTPTESPEWVWNQIKAEARRDAESEPALASYLYSTIISHSSLTRSLSFHLGNKLCSSTLLSTLLYDLFLNTFSSDDSLLSATVQDLRAARARDPACISFAHCLLNYKGFLAIQAHRVAHRLWALNRKPIALALHSRVADVFSVDIHPAARVGKVKTASSRTRSLSFHLGNKLCSSTLLSTLLYDLFLNTFSSDESLLNATVQDLRAARARDPACISFAHCLLNYKGFLAIQAHRVAHRLWALNRKPIALALHSRVADVFSVDIHPAARVGKGNKLCSSTLLYDLFLNTFSSDDSLLSATVQDLRAARARDPACISFAHCLLNYKGFLAIQAHRVAHRLWALNRKPIALALHSRVADVFSVDIHPAARVGKVKRASSLTRSLSFHLGNKLCSSTLLSTLLYDLFLNTFSSDDSLLSATVQDLRAARARDPACISFAHCLLNYKGFLAIQAHRVAHRLWALNRKPIALALHSRVADVFSVDIHPAARVGKGPLRQQALLSTLLYDLFLNTFSSDESLLSATVQDLRAARARDPACISFAHCLLNYKGFLAIQAHRVAHRLWALNRKPIALALHSRVADVFSVDIHPAARVGKVKTASSLTRSLSFHLGNKLCSSTLLSTLLYDLFLNTFSSDESLLNATVQDLRAARARDLECFSFAHCLLNYKGFLAIQAHRVAHRLWALNRKPIALALHSRVADVFPVDIHPAARVGKGPANIPKSLKEYKLQEADKRLQMAIA